MSLPHNSHNDVYHVIFWKRRAHNYLFMPLSYQMVRVVNPQENWIKNLKMSMKFHWGSFASYIYLYHVIYVPRDIIALTGLE